MRVILLIPLNYGEDQLSMHFLSSNIHLINLSTSFLSPSLHLQAPSKPQVQSRHHYKLYQLNPQNNLWYYILILQGSLERGRWKLESPSEVISKVNPSFSRIGKGGGVAERKGFYGFLLQLLHWRAVEKIIQIMLMSN